MSRGMSCSDTSRYCANKQDDILPTFGVKTDNLVSRTSCHETMSDSQSREVSAAWISFIKNLDPNPSSGSNKRWSPFTSGSDVKDVYAVGGGSVGDCPKDLWGTEVKFDWQVYT